MTTIYRVETADGRGPYKSVSMFSRSWLDEAYALDSFQRDYFDDDAVDLRPLPEDDGIGYMNPEEVCAFADVQALLSWFPEDVLEIMGKHDMRVKVYEAPDEKVRRGVRQVVAVKEVLAVIKEVHCAAIKTLIDSEV